MIEYKTLRIDLKNRDSAIEIFGCFGWRLEKSCEYYDETQKSIMHYAFLRFTRDTEMRHYAQLKKMEIQFFDDIGCTLECNRPKRDPFWFTLACVLLLSIYSVLSLFYEIFTYISIAHLFLFTVICIAAWEAYLDRGKLNLSGKKFEIHTKALLKNCKELLEHDENNKF